MATEVEAARQLNYHVCAKIDAGRPRRVEVSMVKLFAAEMAERVTDEALQILGGAGYTTFYPVERCWRENFAGRTRAADTRSAPSRWWCSLPHRNTSLPRDG